MRSILLALVIFLLGCAAPHDNPLDPKSDRYVAPLPEPYVPEFTARVWSEHASYNFPNTDVYQVRVQFTNPDDAFVLDSAWVTYDGRPRVALDRTDGTWAGSFTWTYFGCGQQMDCAIGQPFDFAAKDWRDSSFYVGPVYLFRVISGVPATDEPDSNDVTGPIDILLQWPPFNASFPFGFRATLTRTDSVAILWTSPLLPSAQLLVEVPDSLSDGTYEWTLAVVDSFGNSSRSKEAEFAVQWGSGL